MKRTLLTNVILVMTAWVFAQSGSTYYYQAQSQTEPTYRSAYTATQPYDAPTAYGANRHIVFTPFDHSASPFGTDNASSDARPGSNIHTKGWGDETTHDPDTDEQEIAGDPFPLSGALPLLLLCVAGYTLYIKKRRAARKA